MQTMPNHVRRLEPVPVVLDEPSNTQIMVALAELQDAIMSLQGEIKEIKDNIGITKDVIVAVKDQVTPTLDMLSNGPIGQLLGIAPPPPPRTRRNR